MARIKALYVILFAAIFCAAAYPVVVQAGASLKTDKEVVAKQRINTAGRQRMLTQRMTKSMCLSLLGIETERHRDAANLAADEFDRGLDGLINGSDALGLAAESDRDIRVLLDQIAVLAKGLTPSVRQVASGDVHSVAVALILRRNGPVLDQMNAAVGMMERQQSAGTNQSRVAATLNKAGRQRMLSQRIAKNVCFISIGMIEDRARAELVEDFETFETTLSGLIHGDPKTGILKAPTKQIRNKLNAVKFGWQMIRSTLADVTEGGTVSALELLQIDLQIDAMLRAMDEAVGLWAKEAG